MAKQTVLTVELDPKLKSEAERVLKELGLTPAQAVTLFFKQVVLRQGLPFELRIPKTGGRRDRDIYQEADAVIDDRLDGFDFR